MSYNPEQLRAIQEDGNLIVSAGAGAGKTTVLTERVLRLIQSGIGIEEMLILTFTRAAASEMKNRIEKKLSEAERAETDPEKKRRLQKQLLLCPNACISTIDAFCSSVVHRHYYRLDLPPALKTVTSTEGEVFFEEAVKMAAEALIAEAPQTYHILLRAFNGIKNTEQAIYRLHTFLTAQPDREQWLSTLEEDCRAGRLTERAEQKLLERCREELGAAIRAYENIRNKLDSLGPQSVYSKYVQHADGHLPQLRGALLWNTAQQYREALSAISFDRLPTIKDIQDTEGLKAPFVKCRGTIKDGILKDQIQLFSASGEEEAENEQVSAITEALLTLLRRTEEAFSAMKLEKGKLDFADMEYYTVKLLAIPEVAEEYRRRFKTVIEDEYQDSNYLQEAIINCICGPDNVFLVGDVKQSIYGFRKAVPALFAEKAEKYGRGEGGRRIDLNSNYRSSSEILEAVNSVFSKLMTKETGLLAYDSSQKLNPGREQPKGIAELVLLNSEAGEEDEEGEELENEEAEAMFCVEKIRSLLETEKEPGIRYTYRDFTVLLRKADSMPGMARIFTEEGIPCFYESSKGYFESIEVQLFLNLLRLIDNRRQDIPLISVLRSIVGEYTDEELIRLRKLCPEKESDILDCLLAAAAAEPEGKAAAFLKRLAAWREKSLYMPVRELCTLLLDETGLMLEMCMLPGGRQREANLNEVLTLAGEYDTSGAFGLHGFLHFADKAREKDKVGTAPTEAGNAVRLMTVHKSKGLEFPVVFYCGLGKQFNKMDARADMLLDSELGIGLSYVTAGNIKHEPRLHKLLAKRILSAGMEEEMRVVYVGMTRAMRQLYMVGSGKKLFDTLEKLPAEVSAADLNKALCPLKWLLLLTGKDNPYLPRHIIDKTIFNREDSFGEKSSEETARPDPEKLAALREKFACVYPYPAPAGVPNKTSATALSGEEKVYLFNESPFTEPEAEKSALKHGTDIHALLEKLPLAREKEEERLSLLDPLDVKDRESLLWFTKSELFLRMQSSPLVRRELPFTAAVESGTLPGLESGEQVLLQGVIDCCFIEGEGYIVLDYKTDRFRGVTAEEQAETHREQVELYARVLSRLTGKPVSEKYVVFISERVTVRL